MKALHFIINIFFKIVTAILFIYLIMAIIGLNFYIVPTGSMEPNIKAGSFVLINENAKYSNIKEGDILVYKAKSGNRIIHRAIDISNEGITVQGDANPIPDSEKVTQSNFVGKFIFGIAKLGSLLEKTNKIQYKIIYILATIGLCCLDNRLNRKLEKDEFNKQKEPSL